MARDSATTSVAPATSEIAERREKPLKRRQFIKRVALAGTATAAGATALGGGKLALDRIERAAELARRDLQRPSAGSWFTPAERQLVATLCAMIVPSDGNGPGALESGVVERLDQSLALSSQQRSLYARGLLAFEELAKRRGGRTFVEFSEQEKMALIDELERFYQKIARAGGSTVDQLMRKASAVYRSWPAGAAADFFAVLVEDAQAAFYSAEKAWRWLGYDGPPFSRAYIANFGPCDPAPNGAA